jgi:hypothetical protein
MGCVGLAYFGIAIVVPLAILGKSGEKGSWTKVGVLWSLLAGAAGALGALGVILAVRVFGGQPIYVMPLVFGGAPVVNTVVAMLLHPPAGGIRAIPAPFILGCVLAASGAFLVAKYAPSNTGGGTKPAGVAAPATNAPAR